MLIVFKFIAIVARDTAISKVADKIHKLKQNITQLRDNAQGNEKEKLDNFLKKDVVEVAGASVALLAFGAEATAAYELIEAAEALAIEGSSGGVLGR